MIARFDERLSAVEVEYKEVPFKDEYEINVIELMQKYRLSLDSRSIVTYLFK